MTVGQDGQVHFAVLGVTVTTLGRPPHRAREGHGQHFQIRSLVSNPDDRHADHLGLDATLRPVEPPGDDRRVNALMVFKAVRGSVFTGTVTWVFSGYVHRAGAAHDHPVYFPRGLRGGARVIFWPELDAPAGGVED